MKIKIVLFTLIMIYSIFGISQTCLPEGITFIDQTTIDNFPSNYPGCQVILGDLVIEWMDYILVTNVDSLLNLTEIQGDLIIGGEYGTPIFESLAGFENLTSVGGDLNINGNFELYSLEGLNNLESIGGQLSIGSNQHLQNILALQNLNSVQSLYISQNNELISLSGIDSLDAFSISDPTLAYSVYIANNDQLSLCNVYSICTYLGLPEMDAYIFSNDINCGTINEVIESCVTTVNELDNSSKNFILYPNPVLDEFEIIFDNKSYDEFTISIFNINGQKIHTKNNLSAQSNMDVSDLNPGMYFVKIQFENGEQVTRKFVKD